MAENTEQGYMPLVDPEILRSAEALERISLALGGDIVQTAQEAAAEAEASALVSEGYAVGTQDGTAVSSGTYYQNNSKYYAEQCADIIDGKVSEINSAVSAAETAIENLQKESGYIWFDVNNEDGKLYITYLDQYSDDAIFSVNENTGELIVTIDEPITVEESEPPEAEGE